MSAPLTAVIKAYDVRGVVPDQLDVPAVRALGAAFAEVVVVPQHESSTGRPRAVVGYDMRPSSPELSAAFADGLASRGVDVVVIGLCSTDGLYFASGSMNIPGAMFTASHNPAQYNGIKMCRSGARPVGQDTGLSAIRELAQTWLDAGGVPPVEGLQPGAITEQDLLREYADYLRSLVDLSGARRLGVVVDAGNGMGGHTVPAVLGTAAGLPALPFDVTELYFELDGTFPNHEANPLDPKNLLDLQAAVPKAGADIGLAFDGDADRCFVVDELGAPVSPSAVTALVARREIGKERAAGRDASVIHNLITSQAVPEIITEAGGTPVRTRVGHSFIKQRMADVGAVFGGEHSAHYYFRDFFFADTGMLAALHVLAALAESELPLSELAAEYERYVASGEINSTVADAAAVAMHVEQVVTERAATEGEDVQIDRLDGLTITHPASAGAPMWWFNLRASNTEPLLRLNAEGADEATMVEVRDRVLSLIRGASTLTASSGTATSSGAMT